MLLLTETFSLSNVEKSVFLPKLAKTNFPYVKKKPIEIHYQNTQNMNKQLKKKIDGKLTNLTPIFWLRGQMYDIQQLLVFLNFPRPREKVTGNTGGQ